MIKKHRLSLLQAKACIAAYERIPIRFVEVELGTSLQLAYPNRMWAYDAYVVQSALSLGLPLLTLDGPQAKVAEKVGVLPKGFQLYKFYISVVCNLYTVSYNERKVV